MPIQNVFPSSGLHQKWRASSDGVLVGLLPNLSTCLVSGPRETVKQHFSIGEIYGWPGHVDSDPYFLSLRPDQLAWVGACTIDDGWHPEGFAVSKVTDAYRVFEITGEQRLAFLARGSSMRLDGASGSVAGLFAGFSVWMYHHSVTKAIRFHVESAYSEAFALWCQRTLKAMSSE